MAEINIYCSSFDTALRTALATHLALHARHVRAMPIMEKSFFGSNELLPQTEVTKFIKIHQILFKTLNINDFRDFDHVCDSSF